MMSKQRLHTHLAYQRINEDTIQSLPSAQQESTMALPASSNHDFSKIAISATPAAAGMKVNQPDDAYEQEADQVAEEIMQIAVPTTLTGSNSVRRPDAGSGLLRRKESEPGQGAVTVSPAISEVLYSSGSPLDGATRSFMESRFGHDFSQVRIHTDERAAESAEAVHALAYTVGPHIAFGTRQYAPDTTEGKKLLAHELTHTIQQSSTMEAANVIQRQEAPPAAAAPPGQATADSIADDIYNALYPSTSAPAPEGYGDTGKVMQILQEHAPVSQDIKDSYQKNHQRTLQGCLKERLFGDQLIKSFALLSSSTPLEQHTAMALAIISRDHEEEIFRILENETVQGRKVTEQYYDKTFGRSGNGDRDYIGAGSLRDDLKSFSLIHSWIAQKSIAMLDHDLTSAEMLYFDSVGILGTHTDNVVSRIQTEWSKGPANFASFEADWNNYACNQNGWWRDGAPWTDKPLYMSMYDELSGEAWQLVRAVFEGYNKFKDKGFLQPGASQPTVENDFVAQEGLLFTQEDIRLEVAQKSLEASEGIISDNKEQLYKAIEVIQHIWQEERIKRVEDVLKVAQDAKDTEKTDFYTKKVQDYNDQWAKKRDILKTKYAAKGTEDTESRTVLLKLAGELNMADEVYLAGLKGENEPERVVSLLTSYWAKGKMNDFLQQTNKPKEDTAHNILRPTYNVLVDTVLVTSSIIQKVIKITNERADDATRGADLLKLELDEGEHDVELKHGYDLLTTDGLSSTLREATIQKFMPATDTAVVEGKYIDAFISHISKHYNNSNTVWLFKDLLQPTTDPLERLKRAEGRQEANDSWLTRGTAADLEARESIQRLELIVQKHNASSPELQAMIAMAGIDPTSPDALNKLAETEDKVFQAQLDEVRALKTQIIEYAAKIAQLVAAVTVTVLTGGTLLPALAGLAANIATHEALDWEQYTAATLANAEGLTSIVLQTITDGLGECLAEVAISAERLEQLGRAGDFIKSAIAGVPGKMADVSVDAMYEGKAPGTDALAAAAISLLGSAAADSAKDIVKEALPEIGAMRKAAIASGAKSLFEGIGEQAADMARNGTGKISGGEIAQKLAVGSVENLVKGTIKGAAKAKAEEREKKRYEPENDK